MADPFEAALRAAAKRIRKAAGKGLGDAADAVLDQARELCPTDDGELRASGKAKVDPETLTAAVGFGSGKSAAYAVKVHEDLSDQHDDGQAKFLEAAVNQTGRDRGAQIIGRAIQGAIQ